MRALVLSGGGMFGAWQAGVWQAIQPFFAPDLVVGASVGSLNGWAIAGGIDPQDLISWWLTPEVGVFDHLPQTIRTLMQRYPLRIHFAAILTDSRRIKPAIFEDGEVTWQHLAASCAIPFVLPQYKIGARWYSDGGLLNPLPVWAAVQLGATEIVAMHPVWPRPVGLMKPAVQLFSSLFGHHPQVPTGVNVATVGTPPLGTLDDALHWKRENIERWIGLGREA